MLRIDRQTMHGKYGPFDAYVVSGDTYIVRDQLKRLGFSWYGKDKVWYMSASKWNEAIARQLGRIGAVLPGDAPTTTTPPESRHHVNPLEDTEDVEQTKWHKFPVKSSIRKFNVTFEYKGEATTLPVDIDRWYFESGDKYNPKKSSKNRGIPRYRVRIGDLATFYSGAEGKWDSYDEEKKLDEIQKIVVDSMQNEPKTKMRMKVETQIDQSRREPGLIDALQKIKEDGRGYSVVIGDADEGYNGTFPVKLDYFGDDIWVNSDINSPHIDRQKILGEIGISNIRTPAELEEKISTFLNSDDIRQKYLDFLHSFPFLGGQVEEEEKKWKQIFECVENPKANTDFVLNKLVEMGFVRPHRRQRQEQGLSSGEEIKWIMDHDAVVHGPSSRTPEGFYTLVAYLLHRQIKGIESWSEMGLTMDTGDLVRKIQQFDPDITFEQLEQVLEMFAAAAQAKWGFKDQRKLWKNYKEFYSGGHASKPKDEPAQSENDLLDRLAEMAGRFGVDTTGIRQNPKKIYRELAMKVHPDRFSTEPQKQEEMKLVFQELGNLWEEIRTVHRISNSWYSTAVRYG